MHRIAGLLFSALLLSGCATLLSFIGIDLLDPEGNFNPKYKQGESYSGPTLVANIQDCTPESYADGGIEINERTRQLIGMTFPSLMWSAARQSGEPKFGRFEETSDLCGELLGDLESWDTNAILKAAVGNVLARDPSKKALLVMMVSTRYTWKKEQAAVRSSTGEYIGSVETGQVDRWENGDANLKAFLLNGNGDIIWGAHIVCGPVDGHPYDCVDDFKGAGEAVPKIFASFPWQIL